MERLGVYSDVANAQPLRARLLVHADHHVGGLDHCIGLLTRFEGKLVDCFIGDCGGDDGTACVDADMGGRFAFGYLDNFARKRLRALIFIGFSSDPWIRIAALRRIRNW